MNILNHISNFQLAFDMDRDAKDHNAFLDGMVSAYLYF